MNFSAFQQPTATESTTGRLVICSLQFTMELIREQRAIKHLVVCLAFCTFPRVSIASPSSHWLDPSPCDADYKSMWVTRRKILGSESLCFYYPIRLFNYFSINESHNKQCPASYWWDKWPLNWVPLHASCMCHYLFLHKSKSQLVSHASYSCINALTVLCSFWINGGYFLWETEC